MDHQSDLGVQRSRECLWTTCLTWVYRDLGCVTDHLFDPLYSGCTEIQTVSMDHLFNLGLQKSRMCLWTTSLTWGYRDLVCGTLLWSSVQRSRECLRTTCFTWVYRDLRCVNGPLCLTWVYRNLGRVYGPLCSPFVDVMRFRACLWTDQSIGP